MSRFLFTDLLSQYNWIEQLFLVVAAVSSVLLCLLLLLNAFGVSQEVPSGSAHKRILNPLTILIFFTFLGWTSVLGCLWLHDLAAVLSFAIPLGFMAATMHFWIEWMHQKRLAAYIDPKSVLKTTGEVSQYIPSSQNGRGKVHLNLRYAPPDLDAVSTGMELKTGCTIRVVDVIDNHILVVEPLDRSPDAPDDDSPRG